MPDHSTKNVIAWLLVLLNVEICLPSFGLGVGVHDCMCSGCKGGDHDDPDKDDHRNVYGSVRGHQEWCGHGDCRDGHEKEDQPTLKRVLTDCCGKEHGTEDQKKQ
jgi:hypothetical protein